MIISLCTDAGTRNPGIISPVSSGLFLTGKHDQRHLVRRILASDRSVPAIRHIQPRAVMGACLFLEILQADRLDTFSPMLEDHDPVADPGCESISLLRVHLRMG